MIAGRFKDRDRGIEVRQIGAGLCKLALVQGDACRYLVALALTVATLKSKRDEVSASAANYERMLAQARADLAHLNAAISIFEAAEGRPVKPYVDIFRVYRRGEMYALCKAALDAGAMNTRQLTLHVMIANGLDAGDRCLLRPWRTA